MPVFPLLVLRLSLLAASSHEFTGKRECGINLFIQLPARQPPPPSNSKYSFKHKTKGTYWDYSSGLRSLLGGFSTWFLSNSQTPTCKATCFYLHPPPIFLFIKKYVSPHLLWQLQDRRRIALLHDKRRSQGTVAAFTRLRGILQWSMDGGKRVRKVVQSVVVQCACVT